MSSTNGTPALTPASLALMRKVFGLLEDHFESDKGTYAQGWSDERISKETGASVDGVKKYRLEAGFGKLAAPTELSLLQNDVKEIETLFLRLDTEVKDRLKDVQARLRTLQKKFD